MSRDATRNKAALLVVDVQHDFLPGGSLGVPDGDAILPVVREMLGGRWDYVVASQDFHPPGHVSFASTHGRDPFTAIDVPNPLAELYPNSDPPQPETVQQMLWPDHCVQGTRGCEIEESIKAGVDEWIEKGKGHVEQKGTNLSLDAYSAFSNFLSPSPSSPPTTNAPIPSASILSSLLHQHGFTSLYVVGLATDYCVRASALDAVSVPGVEEVYVVREGVRAVGGEEASEVVWKEFAERGVKVAGVDDVRAVWG